MEYQVEVIAYSGQALDGLISHLIDESISNDWHRSGSPREAHRLFTGARHGAEPMPVPIRDIARKKLGLKVLERHLTEDLSVYGQMCFTNGVAEIYDPENEEYKEIRVRWGTMIIDPDTITKRNIGCMNNTIAHETVHWWKHRDYHILQSVIDKRLSKVYKCPTAELDEGKQDVWTDENWMEWQAVNLAPRILMPIQTFTVMAERFMEEYSAFPVTTIPQKRWVVQRLSDFYLVSKQSAAIRLSELEIL